MREQSRRHVDHVLARVLAPARLGVACLSIAIRKLGLEDEVAHALSRTAPPCQPQPAHGDA